MSKEKHSDKDVIAAWSEKAGREDQYDLRVVESSDGTVQTQLLDKDTGSLTIAVDGEGADANRRLIEEAGSALLDAGVPPKEATGPESEKSYTSRGALATPTQPEVMSDPAEPVEVNPKVDEGRVAPAVADDPNALPEDKLSPDRSSSTPGARAGRAAAAADETQPSDNE